MRNGFNFVKYVGAGLLSSGLVFSSNYVKCVGTEESVSNGSTYKQDLENCQKLTMDVLEKLHDYCGKSASLRGLGRQLSHGRSIRICKSINEWFFERLSCIVGRTKSVDELLAIIDLAGYYVEEISGDKRNVFSKILLRPSAGELVEKYKADLIKRAGKDSKLKNRPSEISELSLIRTMIRDYAELARKVESYILKEISGRV